MFYKYSSRFHNDDINFHNLNFLLFSLSTRFQTAIFSISQNFSFVHKEYWKFIRNFFVWENEQKKISSKFIPFMSAAKHYLLFCYHHFHFWSTLCCIEEKKIFFSSSSIERENFFHSIHTMSLAFLPIRIISGNAWIRLTLKQMKTITITFLIILLHFLNSFLSLAHC
jgi:hypothetical protein